MRVKLFRAAEARLLEVWDYTERTWGERQADAYVRELVAEIEDVAGRRARWRTLGDRALPGVYFFRHRHHYVFFRELTAGRIGVISVLHEKMDLPARLRDDVAG